MFIRVSADGGLRPAFLLQSPKVPVRCEMITPEHQVKASCLHLCKCTFLRKAHLYDQKPFATESPEIYSVLRAVLPTVFIRVATTGTADSVLSLSLQ